MFNQSWESIDRVSSLYDSDKILIQCPTCTFNCWSSCENRSTDGYGTFGHPIIVSTPLVSYVQPWPNLWLELDTDLNVHKRYSTGSKDDRNVSSMHSHWLIAMWQVRVTRSTVGHWHGTFQCAITIDSFLVSYVQPLIESWCKSQLTVWHGLLLPPAQDPESIVLSKIVIVLINLFVPLVGMLTIIVILCIKSIILCASFICDVRLTHD